MREIINKSYEINFIMLVAISILVFIRSIQSNLTDKTRISLQLSAFVTTIAAMHYYLMTLNKENVVQYRYFDWIFTTPILLIDLCLILDITDKGFILEIIGYNTAMMMLGYLGELDILSMITSTFVGFIPFIILFYRIYDKVKSQTNTPEERKRKMNILTVFVGLWALYGINHLYKNALHKNGIYNILDFITKGMFALYIYNSSWNI
jgi:bacteriorhodopsin